MTLKLIAGSVVEPVTLDDAKLAGRVDGAEFDALIPPLIQTAREQAEHELGRPLVTQAWELSLDAFPAVELELGMPPVRSITWIRYVDRNGAEQTIPPMQYSLDDVTPPGWVLPAVNTRWPGTMDTANAVRVRFVAGLSATEVPEAVKTWIKANVAYWLRNAEAASDRPHSPSPFLARLLDPYRTYR